MVPNSNLGKWRSIEFECIFKSYQALAEFEDWLRGKEFRNMVTIQHDGSIEATRGGTTREIVVSYCSGVSEQTVKDVCRYLAKRAYVNQSCGTHVHFDMRHVTAQEARVYGAKLACVVPVLKMTLPQSRRNNHYCRQDFADLYGDRYAFVNLTAYAKYKTIEVRGHSGTLNAEKILNWIAICEQVMFGETNKASKDIKEFVKDYKINKTLAEYMEKRYTDFNTLTRAGNARRERG